MPAIMPARLDTQFESWGGFSKALEDSRTIPGRFSYDPAIGAQLDVTEPMEEFGTNAFPTKAPAALTIFGQLVDGTFVTLGNCVRKSFGFGAGIGSPTVYLVSEAFIGGHIVNREQFRVKRYSIELSSLLAWMTEGSPIIGKNARDADGADRIEILCRRISPIKIVIEEQGFTVEIAHGMGWHSSLSTGTVVSNGVLTIEPKDDLLLSRAYELAWQCQQLMGLLIGEQLSVGSIEIVPSAEIPQNYPQPIRQLIHYFGKKKQSEILWPFMMLPYGQLGGRFATIVERWLKRSDQSVLATNVFFGAELVESPAVNIRFIEMAQAAESYHRSLGTGQYMKQEDFERVVAAYIGAIPQEIQGDHRRSLAKRLKYANQYSFRKRIGGLLNRIPENVKLKIAGNVGKFVSRITATRNFYTHFDHASEQEEAALQGRDALAATERLRILVVANLLHDLGVEDELLLTVLERDRRCQFWMNEHLAL